MSSSLKLITSYIVNNNNNNGSLYNGYSMLDVFKADIIAGASNMIQDKNFKKHNFFILLIKSMLIRTSDECNNLYLKNNDFKIVLIPKTDSHLRAIFDILRNLKNSKIDQILFITFTKSFYNKIKNNGFNCFLLDDYIRLNFFDIAHIFKLWFSNFFQIRKALINVKLDKPVASALHSCSNFVLSKNLVAFYKLDKLLLNLFTLNKPDLMIIGNPNTFEGRLGAIFSKSKGIKSVSLQHGRIDLLDPIINEPIVDSYFTWGRIPYNIMISKGVNKNKLKIAGAPWLDNFKYKLSKNSNNEKHVLIALSGAGHMTGFEEHKSNIEMLTEICGENKDINFIFKLHFKDKIEYYITKKGSYSYDNMNVISGYNNDKNIFDFLKKSFLLITTGSTAAIDAMIMRVPVITFDNDKFQRKSNDFINFGATYHAKNKAEINSLIRKLFQKTLIITLI